MKLQQKIENALLSQAVGDAIGDPMEFMRDPKDYDFEMALNRSVLNITDDTQMALFGLHGLIEARRGCNRLELNVPPLSGVDPKVLSDTYLLPAYLAWYATQTDKRPNLHPHPLVREKLLQVPRAPGLTCLGSLEAITLGRSSVNDSMGNGTVMRSLPFVFANDLLGGNEVQATALAVAASQLTHGHVEASRAVRIYMRVALALKARADENGGLFSEGPHFVIQPVLRSFDRDYPEVAQALDLRYQIGNTFTAMPALQLALRALYQEQNGVMGVLKAATVHEGDSDTTGAIAMGLYGLVYPAPNALVNKVAEADIIRRVCAMAGGLHVRGAFSGGTEVQSES